MQDFFFVGIICAIAIGVLLVKSILFVAHLVSLKHSNEIIRNNEAQLRLSNLQSQQVQGTNQSIETVMNWRIEDPRLSDEQLRQQFLTKTKTRKTPTSDRVSPRDRVPLATTDMGEFYQDEPMDQVSVPIYTYDPTTGSTQV